MPARHASDTLSAGLYLVATPIGNLEDITLRALSVLGQADLVLAEDTRRTRKLLSHFDIRASMKSLHDHNEASQASRLVARMKAGERLALVSDAGTPLVSDPGHGLVREAIAAGIRVVPIPGPSALLAAITASGLALDRFVFVGYLPRKPGARLRFFESVAEEPGTIVFLESPRRLPAALAAAAGVFGERRACVARELTKVHEEFIRGTLPAVAAHFADTAVRGEVTVCVAGAAASSTRADAEAGLDLAELERDFALLLNTGTPRNEALRELARRHGVPRRAIYQALLVDEEETS